MGLYDIIDEIAEKQVTKTETGDNRIFGVVIGIVTDNYDAEMKGRVCVNIPVRDKEANNLKWARVAMPSSGKEWGHYFLPEVGDQVLLVFEQGNIEKPYVIGCIPKASDKFLSKSVDKDNQKKRIVTKHGSTIEFFDAKEGDGEKDIINIYTANSKHKILINNEKNEILISDKEGENSIRMQTEDGKMTVKAKERLTIEVSDSIKINCNGSNGTVTVDCKKVKMKSSEDILMEANGKAKLSGGNVNVAASTALKLDSSGTTKVGGKPIALG